MPDDRDYFVDGDIVDRRPRDSRGELHQTALKGGGMSGEVAQVLYTEDEKTSYQTGKRKRHAVLHIAMHRFKFERCHMYVEFFSFLAIIVSAPLALMEYHRHNTEIIENLKKERLQAAEKAYRDVDARYTDFIRLCLSNPRLDCYSVPRKADNRLGENDIWQQKILYTVLTDVFEVAYVQYQKNQHARDPEVKEIFAEQWHGWDNYIQKFLTRPAYCQVYNDIRDEYDTGLVKYMDGLAAKSCINTFPVSKEATDEVPE